MTLSKDNDKKEFKHIFDSLMFSYRKYEKKRMEDSEDDSWEKINDMITHIDKQRIRKRNLYITSIAASVLLILGVSLYLYTNNTGNDTYSINELANSTIADETFTSDEILLITTGQQKVNIENNANVEYDKDGTVVVNSQQVGQSVTSASPEEKAYNQIIVPKGKRTNIYFADGSRIFVNSGTRVIYPAVFDDNIREVFVDGEIYLEVAKDQSRPFIVKTDQFNVRVLGTSFGISAYKEDPESSVALLTGKVEIETSNKEKVMLSPDELFTFKDAGTTVRKVNASEYIAWINGIMVLNKEPLTNVLTRLSRHYGKVIKYPTGTSDLIVNGKLDLKDNIESVISNISLFAPITYSLNNDTVVIDLSQ